MAGSEFFEIPDPTSNIIQSASSTISGRVFQPQQHILLYSSEEWEAFIREWVHYQKSQYQKVLRLTGANDQGIDVAGFVDSDGDLQGIWDNFQCKHYQNPLTPTDGLKEIAKILWHSFSGSYKPPRKYYFIAPKECGMTLSRLLGNADNLKKKVVADWDKTCKKAVTSSQEIPLDGAFKIYVDSFDFSIFSFRTTLEIIDEHRNTPYHYVRFGGGLPDRPAANPVPQNIDESESVYVRQLFEAYSDHKKEDCPDLEKLNTWSDLLKHFHDQREYFYQAEALRNFARDNVPQDTYDNLQNEIYHGVIDVEDSSHTDGLSRLRAVMQSATQLSLTSNPLIGKIEVQDRKGICHQLANADSSIKCRRGGG
jgi:hypothetical protein